LVRKYSISEDDYRMMEVAIIENKPHKAGPQWKFAGAFYFSTVVLAMIGNESKTLQYIYYIKLCFIKKKKNYFQKQLNFTTQTYIVYI